VAALLLKAPALNLSPGESVKLAEAINDVLAQYSIALSPRVMAWLKLGAVGVVVYGPRAAAIVVTRKAPERQPQTAEQRAHTGAAAVPGAPAMDFSAVRDLH